MPGCGSAGQSFNVTDGPGSVAMILVVAGLSGSDVRPSLLVTLAVTVNTSLAVPKAETVACDGSSM